jgi:hypothetical protein
MEHAKLLVHRGATRVNRAELTNMEPPAATDTWKPIKHATLVGAIHEELALRDMTVVQEEYAVQRQNNMLFSVMVLNYLQTDEFAAALAFRHANDRSEALKMYAGVKVFTCDNMSLSGDEIILHKKHSPRFQLAAALPEAFDRYQHSALQLTRDIDELKGTPCSHRDAKETIYDIFRRRLVPLRLFHPVVESWHRQLPEDQHSSNAWVLHNCFTEHLKHLPPNVAMRATVRLGRFFGLGTPVTAEEEKTYASPTRDSATAV